MLNLKLQLTGEYMNTFLKITGLLVLALAVIPLFLSSHFSMTRAIEINAPVLTVFSKLSDLNEYNKWNPFPEGDSTNQTYVTGLGVGSTLIWKCNKTGEGKMTITGINPNKSVDVKMEFYKPMSGEGLVRWVLNSKSDSVTEMVWSFEQGLPYFSRYFGLVMDSMMGKHFEKGLLNYKALVESQAKLRVENELGNIE